MGLGKCWLLLTQWVAGNSTLRHNPRAIDGPRAIDDGPHAINNRQRNAEAKARSGTHPHGVDGPHVVDGPHAKERFTTENVPKQGVI
eukprot:scaffold45238_cov19-Tisochrysis_lutea.AAC.5